MFPNDIDNYKENTKEMTKLFIETINNYNNNTG